MLDAVKSVTEVQEQQELAGIIAEEGFKKVGDYAAVREAKDKDWADGGWKKTAAHSLMGAVVASVAGGDIAQGALSAGTREAMSGLTADTKSEFLQQVVSTAIGAAIGGEAGAAVALQGEKFNRQLHQKEIALVKKNAEQFAKMMACRKAQGYCTESEVSNTFVNSGQIKVAESQLIREALGLVDYYTSTQIRKAGSEFEDNEYEARRFILSLAGYQEILNDDGTKSGQTYFSASREQYMDPFMNLNNLYSPNGANIDPIDGAAMADYVYGRGNLPQGYSKLTEQELNEYGLTGKQLVDTNSGFHSEVYKTTDSSGNVQLVVAYRGTEMSPVSELAKDFHYGNNPQAFGKVGAQYNLALLNSTILSYANKDVPIAFVGHSLGGGLAGASSQNTSLPATTYNAAGVHENTVPWGNGNNVNNHFVRGEILTTSQVSSPAPNATGTQHGYDTTLPDLPWYKKGSPYYSAMRSIDLHGMQLVLDAMKASNP